MLGHQLGQDLVLGLDLLLQLDDPPWSAEWFGRAFCSKSAAPLSKNSFYHR